MFDYFKKRPSKSQWRQFLKVLEKKERIFFFSILALFIFSSSTVLTNLYFKNTKIAPSSGGTLTEGMVGSPMLINPVYAAARDADRDLAELIFAGLMELTRDYQILEEGKIFEFYLKDKIFWQDGRPITVDDVIFTIKIIQNPDYKSPLRANWLGVDLEKISNSGQEGIRFKLKNPSAIFLENAALKILPKHIWENISPQNFPLAIYNLKPVGSGPYRLKNVSQDKKGKIISLTLIKSSRYFGKRPNISQIAFKFFDSENDLIKAAQNGQVKSFSLTDSARPVNFTSSTNLYPLSLPRYFALFLNAQNSKFLGEKEIRQALNYGTNKAEIIDKVWGGRGLAVDSPILPEIYGLKAPLKIYEFQPGVAKELLEKAGFSINDGGNREKIVKKENQFQFKSALRVGSSGAEVQELQKCLRVEVTGYFGEKTKTAVISFQEKYLGENSGDVLTLTRKKLNETCFGKPEEKVQLSFILTTPNQPQLVSTANLLKEQWRSLGIKIEIKALDISVLEREIIKPRNYEILLFGEVLGAAPDPFPFWHSSQKKDPGLNLTSFENKQADKLLEDARQTMDKNGRNEKLENFQNILIENAPAIFLYNPDYLYFLPKKIKGLDGKTITDPSKRFSDVENWYIKTERVWK